MNTGPGVTCPIATVASSWDCVSQWSAQHEVAVEVRDKDVAGPEDDRAEFQEFQDTATSDARARRAEVRRPT